MTIPLVAATFFCGNIEASRSFLEEHGYIPKAISKSQIHAITPRGFELKIVCFLLTFSIQCL